MSKTNELGLSDFDLKMLSSYGPNGALRRAEAGEPWSGFPPLLANLALTLAHLPRANAEWSEIEDFALTFNGYDAHGSFEACATIANERRSVTLTDLRTCLFFEQRRWRHFGEWPKGDDLAYLRWLVEEVRKRVASGDLA